MNRPGSYPYRAVDVFNQDRPRPVFPDAAGLDSVTMEQLGRELNLS